MDEIGFIECVDHEEEERKEKLSISLENSIGECTLPFGVGEKHFYFNDKREFQERLEKGEFDKYNHQEIEYGFRNFVVGTKGEELNEEFYEKFGGMAPTCIKSKLMDKFSYFYSSNNLTHLSLERLTGLPQGLYYKGILNQVDKYSEIVGQKEFSRRVANILKGMKENESSNEEDIFNFIKGINRYKFELEHSLSPAFVDQKKLPNIPSFIQELEKIPQQIKYKEINNEGISSFLAIAGVVGGTIAGVELTHESLANSPYASYLLNGLSTLGGGAIGMLVGGLVGEFPAKIINNRRMEKAEEEFNNNICKYISENINNSSENSSE